MVVGRRANLRRVLRLMLATGTLARSFAPGRQAHAGELPGADAQWSRSVLDRVWTAFHPGQRVWAYADRHSVVAGESFNLLAGCRPDGPPAKVKVTISRVGAYPGGTDRRACWTSSVTDVPSIETPGASAAAGADWPVLLANIDTKEWDSGYYTVDTTAEDGWVDPNVASIVVTDPARSGDVLLKISTNTFQAYNRWGGHSLYQSAFGGSKGTVVSFDRPCYPAFFDYEVYFVIWMDSFARKAGIKVNYISDFDLHSQPELITGYKLLVSQGHDEYWSKEMFDAVERRLSLSGGNTVFLGANTAYWQMRYADIDRAPATPDRGRQMVCHKSMADPLALRTATPAQAAGLVTAKYRDEGRRPETMLTGVAYQNWFQIKAGGQPRYPYVAIDTSLPFFSGTGWRPGEPIGDVVGYEWDNHDPEGDGRRLWLAGVSQIPLLPANLLHVLFRGAPIDVNDRPGVAEAVYFETPAGARVFASGTTRWNWGLGYPGVATEAFRRFNHNLVLWMLGRTF